MATVLLASALMAFQDAHAPQTRPKRGRSIALAAAALLASAGMAQGQAPTQGQSFADVRFPQADVSGRIAMSAVRAVTWREGDVDRVILDGRVRLELGGFSTHATRAVLWIRRLPDEAGRDVRQVYAFLDEPGSPADSTEVSGLSARRLPVRGVVALIEAPTLTADLVEPGPPPSRGARESDAALLAMADAALVRTLTRLTTTPDLVMDVPAAPRSERAGSQAGLQGVGPQDGDTPSGRALPAAPSDRAAGAAAAAGPANRPDAIFAPGGIITVAPGNITVVSGEAENAVIASGGVTIVYQESGRDRTLQLSAQRAVIFLDPGPLEQALSLSVERVRGMYLEGDVQASDGRATLRSPQVYYDVRQNRAVAIEAVFWTYDEARRLPLYVRAETIRQESLRQWTAQRAVFTNSAFHDPELAIGASSVTISRVEQPSVNPDTGEAQTQTRTLVDARDITLRAMGVPFFYWPRYSGDPARQVIRDLRVENASGSGGAIKATVNAYALLGLDPSRDVAVDLLTDLYFERGPALGVSADWRGEGSAGSVFAYSVPLDRGVDVFKSGAEANRNEEFRGMILAEQRWKLSENWTILGEAAYLSDEAFVDAFFEDLGEIRREFTTRLAARRTQENTSFAVQAEGNLNEFVSNEWLLQSRGYSVTRLPEATYVRQADDLLPGVEPGLLTSFTELRVGRLNLSFDESLAQERGLTTDTLAQRALRVNAAQSPGDRLRALGYDEDAVLRGDLRQEFVLSLDAGPIRVNPFVTGRFTGYDTSFEDFAGGEADEPRAWGGAGLRVSTRVQRVYDGVSSRVLDLNRLRHIIEPSVTLFAAGTNVQSRDLPVFDDDVEAINDGSMTRLGVTQTFQTKRGVPGNERSADVVILSTDIVFSDNNVDPRSPIGRWSEVRPENASAGDFFVSDLVWNLTDALSITGASVFDLDSNQQAMTAGGLLLRHSPRFRTYLDARFLNPQDSTLISLGSAYEFTTKYTFSTFLSYDATAGGFQGASVELRRSFSAALLGLAASYNDITGETSFGFIFRPWGATGEGRVSGVGASDPRSVRSRFGG